MPRSRFRVEVQQHLKLADSSIQRLGLLQVSLSSNGGISSVGEGGLVGFLMRSPHKMFSYTTHIFIWGFPTIVVPQNGWFVMENPIKMDDLLGVPLFLETPISKPGSFCCAKRT